MTENSTTSSSSAPSPDYLSSLIHNTVNALKEAAGKPEILAKVVTQFFQDATAAGIDAEEIENMLGINEPSIMDLANLSEEDEENVINAFEQLLST